MKGMRTLALLLTLTGSVWAVEERTRIELPEQFIIADASISEVTLGSLAVAITAKTPELTRQLENLVVSESPEPGETKRVSRNHIIRQIRVAQLPFYEIDVHGNSTFDLYGPGQNVSVDKIVRALNRSILQETGWPEDELVMRVNMAPSQDLWLPPGQIEVAFDRYRDNRLGSTRVEASFYINRIQVEKVSLGVTIERKRTIPVLARDMKRGEVIGPDDVIERVVFIKSEHEDERLIDDPQMLVGNKIRYAVNQHEPVTSQNLETNYILRRGDLVEVILSNGGLMMSTQAKARDRAAPGQIILVETIQTGKVIKARVINRNQVEWIQS